jgi:hypothetical protein
MGLEVPVKVKLDGMPEVEKGLAGIGGSFTKMTAAFASGQAVFELAKKGLEALKNITIESVKAYDDEVVSHARLKAGLGEHAEALIKFAKNQQESTRYSHDEVEAAESTLMMHKLNSAEILKLMPVIENYAAKSGHGLVETANAFTYAIQYGSTRSLRQFGVELDKGGSQQSIFNDLVKLGEGNVKGFAEQLGKIGAGPFIKIKNDLGETSERFGELISTSAIWLATLWSAKAALSAINFILDPMNTAAKEETAQHEKDLATIQRKIKFQQELLRLSTSIKFAEKEGGSVTFVDAVGKTINVSLEKAKEIQARLAGTVTALTPEAEKTKLGTDVVGAGADKAKADAKKQLEEARKRYKDQEKALDDFQKQQNKTVDEIGNRKENAARDRYKKQEEDLKKFEKEQNDISAKGAIAREEIAKEEARKKKELQDATRNAEFSIAEDSIRIAQDIALMSKAGAREQAALAGTMATVQAAQAIMNIWAAPSLIPDPLGMALKISETGVVAADTAVQIARISGAKFAGGTVSVPGTGGGDSVNAWVKPGEMIANQGQKDNILAAIMNGSGGTTNNSASHTYHINNSVTVMGNIDPRAARDFNVSREASDRRLVLQLRRLNMSGQSQGVYSR